MKVLFLSLVLTVLTACSAMMPDLFKTVDDIATDDAILIQVDRDALKKDTDVHISVDVLNKDAKEASLAK